jgi:hypothetical protein
MIQAKRQLTILRRLAVLVTLLCAPSVFQIVWYVSLNRKPPFLNDYGAVLAYFSWGASNTYPLIGIWLVSRDRLFNSSFGVLRAIAYFLAANYGWVAGSALQDWLHSDINGFPVAGTRLEHFGLAALLSVEIATCAWLFWPMLFVFHRRLMSRELSATEASRPNIRFLLAWTALAAVILMSIRLLATYGEPLNIGMAGVPIWSVMKECAMRLPLQIVHLVSIAVIMIGFANRPKHWLIALILAIVIQFAGEQTLFRLVSIADDPRSHYGVLAGPWAERLPFFFGTVFIAFAASGFARATGLVFAGANKPTLRD